MCVKPKGVADSPTHAVPVAQFKEDFLTYTIPAWNTESYDHEALLDDYRKISLHANGVITGIHINAAYGSNSREPIAQLIQSKNQAKLVYWSSIFQWVSQTPYPLQDIIDRSVISKTTPNALFRLNKNAPTNIDTEEYSLRSPDILNAAITVQAQRGQEYDQGKEERNMGRIVEAFNAVHGTTLTEAQGHHFMSVVKAVRLFSVENFHKDSAVDFVSYGALMGEAKSQGK